MKNKENFMKNLVVPAQKLFGNEIVWRRNGSQRNWCRRKWRRRNCRESPVPRSLSFWKNLL